MLEPTKKRRTEGKIFVSFMGPVTNVRKAIEAMKSFDFVEMDEAVPWREAFPHVTPDREPGTVLRGLRFREGLAQVKLAALTGIPQRHISEMENGKRSIGRENAKKLALALNADYRTLL